MSQSDYLSVKKKRVNSNVNSNQSNQFRILNKQYITIQTTPIINEDNEYEISLSRYNISLPEYDLAVLDTQQTFSYISKSLINKPNTIPYIKNYITQYCWYCDNMDPNINSINYDVNMFAIQQCMQCNFK